MTELTQARLRELLDYDPETGVFRWRIPRKRIRVGNPAGSPDRDGYILIGIDRKLYKSHRLVWLYVHGRWPKEEIDHRDRDKANNRLSNLREATHGQNAANRPARKGNAAKGIYYERRRDHYVAQIRDGNRNIYLGSFPTADAAGRAYAEAAKRVHGEFARAS